MFESSEKEGWGKWKQGERNQQDGCWEARGL